MSVSEHRFTPPRRLRLHGVVIALIAAALAAFALVVQAPIAGASNFGSQPTSAAGILPFPGDVYTLGSNGSLIAVDPSTTPASAPLFNLGGQPLNLTWGQFSSATASSRARTVAIGGAGYTQVRISLSGLIPGGVYSLFYRTFGPDSVNPVCGPVDGLVALTARHPQRQKPDSDSFVADSLGKAKFSARVAGRLLDAQNLLVDVIYHFDGNVYGPVPTRGEAGNNCRPSFGIDAMRQFLIVYK